MNNTNEKMTDYDIIKSCLEGDKDAFAVLVNRYKNLVYSIVLRMVNDREECNDIAQEVFIKIYKNLDKYYPSYKFSTWVIRITTNHVIDYRRKKRAEIVPIDDVEYGLTTSKSPEEEYIQKEKKNNLEQLINELPQMYKVPIVLYHQQGLSYQEIADAMNISLSKVKNRIFRGRRMLKDELSVLKESDGYGV